MTTSTTTIALYELIQGSKVLFGTPEVIQEDNAASAATLRRGIDLAKKKIEANDLTLSGGKIRYVNTPSGRAAYIYVADIVRAKKMIVGVFANNKAEDLVDGRHCTRCGEFLPWKFFSVDRKGKHGHRSCCRVCRGMESRGFRINTHVRVYTNAKPDDPRVPVKKYCCKCQSIKYANQFHKNRAAYDGLNAYCKECRRARRANG